MAVEGTKKITPVRRFIKLFHQDTQAVFNLYVFALFAAIVSLSLPLGIQAIINLIVSGQVTTSFYILIILVLLGYTLNGYLQVLQISVSETLQRKVFAKASFDFAFRAPRFNLSSIQDLHAPEIMNRFFDTLNLQKGIPKILIDFAGSSLQIFIGLILLCFYHPFFILFGILTLLVVFFIVRILSPAGLATALKQSKYKYEVAHWLEELARTIDAFKLAGTTDYPLRQADIKTMNYLNARSSHFRTLLFHYYSLIIFKILIAGGFLLLGGLLVIDQQMNIGQFVASEIIILIILSNTEKLIYSMDSIYDMLTALEKLGSVTDIPLERSTGMDVPILREHNGLDLEIENLTYAPYGGRKILNNISLSIPAGQKVLFTGYSGSGKHTLLQLLNGLYDDYEGVIKYNGVSVRSLNLLKLRDLIGDTMSKDSIFKGSFLDNLTMGNPIPMDQVLKVIKITSLDGFLDRLENGFDTDLVPEGKSLNRSTKSKILVARCLLKNPKIIMLDENIDFIREYDKKIILDYIFSDEHNWTIISVNYNITHPKYFDMIYCFKDGSIFDVGTYDEVKDTEWFNELIK